MRNSLSIITILILGLLFLVTCNKKSQPVSELDMIRNSNNTASYPSVHMDSAQAIRAITKQKIQEVLDLSILYVHGKKTTKIDSLIFEQLGSYFHQPDSTTYQTLFNEIDSLRVQKAFVKNVNLRKIWSEKIKDSMDTADFNVEYQTVNGSLNMDRQAQFILVSAPVKFKKEFRFFFINFYPQPEKVWTATGVTKTSNGTSTGE